MRSLRTDRHRRCLIKNNAAKNPVRPRKNTAEGGCGGNSAVFLQKIEAKPAALLVESRTPQESFLFLLEEKIRRAQNEKSKEYFSVVRRVVTSGGGAASLVPFKESSSKVYNYSTKPNQDVLYGYPGLCLRRGFEPTTNCLTGNCATAALPGNIFLNKFSALITF